MKKITKLFVAVAVLVVGFACTTDATEDLGVVVGGHTEIVLSLESSRAQLGEKADGVYPLYWSEGDKIAVNGVVSEALAASAEGKPSATFTVNGVVARPYNIVYPAAEGVTAVAAGCYPVVFPATQNYVAGNVDGRAVVMYGYAEEGTAPALNHLTGVLRFAVKGDATLASLSVTSSVGALAGTYDVNCANGELTAQEGSTSNTVSMSFGDGLTLGTEATPIYVAVPAGEYGTIECLFITTDGKKMVASFDSTAKPITVGKVREFAEMTFVAESVDGEVLEIYDVTDMQTFASQLALSSWKQVKVMNNIDMTGVEWTPVEGFTGVFDGQDKEIKGLTKPLFGTTSATIKNVHLKEVALNVTDTTFAGSLVITLESTAEQTAVVTNCSAEGTIIYSNNAITPTSDFQTHLINVGGLIGRAYAATITKCVNRVNIDIKLSTPADISTAAKKKVSPGFGGIIGLMDTANETITAVPIIEECVNYGSITNNDSKSNVTYSSPMIAGIAGGINAKNAIVTKCENYGVMTNTKAIRQGDVAGIVGRTYAAEVSHCVNHEGANMVFTNEGRYSFIGGIVGDAYAGAFSYCTNKGEIQYMPSANSTSGYQWMGGVVAYTRSSKEITIKNCVNEAKITHSGNVRNGTTNCYIVVGGVAGNVTTLASLADCENKGEILITGVKGNTSTETAAYTCVGGVIGRKTTSDGTVLRCTNDGVVNYNVTIYGKGTVSDHYVGGVAGSLVGSASDCVNNAEININTQVEVVADAVPAITVVAGGCIGNSNTGTISNFTNKGAVTFLKDAKTYGYSIGGIVGHATSNLDKCTNEGAISAYGDTVECDGTLVSIKIGALGGFASTVKNSTNLASGKVTVKGKVYPSGEWPNETRGTSIGGLFGHKNSTTTNCHNYAPLDVTVNTAQPTLYTMVGGFYIGGLVGYVGSSLTDCSNNGDISVDGTYDLYLARYGHLNISGCISRLAAAAYNNVDNHGNITVNVVNTAAKNTHGTDVNHLYVGGVVSGFGGSTGLTGCDNSGKIVVGEGTVVDNVYIVAGGVCANTAGNGALTNCHNSGDIECHGTSKYGIVVGGLLARHTAAAATVTDCSNSGNVLVTKGEKGESYGKGVYMGGLAGSQSTNVVTVTNFRNSGKMIFKGKSTDVTRIAGVVGSHTQSATAWTGIVNVGDIDFLPADKSDYIDSKTHIGGLVGNSAKGIANAVCYCSINAVEVTNVGIALGTARSSSSIAANCQLGGVVAGEYNIEDEEYKSITLDSSNFFNYIYGGATTDWGDSTDYDGCTVLTSKPTLE